MWRFEKGGKRMTARQFARIWANAFSITEEEALYQLDRFFEYKNYSNLISYSKFPDAHLPDYFVESVDEPFNYADWLDKYCMEKD